MTLKEIVFTFKLISRLSGDELGAVDELGEVCVVGHHQTRKGPLLWVLLPTDLHVDHLHLFAVLQSLKGKLVRMFKDNDDDNDKNTPAAEK